LSTSFHFLFEKNYLTSNIISQLADFVNLFGASKKWKGVLGGGKLFARERQPASACPSGQNAETNFSSSLIEKMGGA